MPGTFSQIYIQVVFAVKGRENFIAKPWRDDLHKYIAGIFKGKEQKSIIVNGVTPLGFYEDKIKLTIILSPPRGYRMASLYQEIKHDGLTL